MSKNIKGSDKLKKELNRLSNNAEQLSQKDSVTFGELFNDQFITKNTSFTSLDELFDNSPFTVESEEDFVAIPDDEWEEYISENTDFSSWKDMQIAAQNEWLDNQLFS